MNPYGLGATGLLVWGVVAHLIADWPLQNAWIAANKSRRRPGGRWWDRHDAAWVHAVIHFTLLAFVFGWPAVFVAAVHLVIDTRTPVAWWGRVTRQTEPAEEAHFIAYWPDERSHSIEHADVSPLDLPMLLDMGTLVRMATDQVAHVATIAVAALIVGSLG